MIENERLTNGEARDAALRLIRGPVATDLSARSDWPTRVVKGLLDDHRLGEFNLCDVTHDTCYGADWPCDVVTDIIQASGHCKHHWLPAHGGVRVCQICDRWEDAR